jgi:uncharacterized protein YbjT (DUF2867 family)
MVFSSLINVTQATHRRLVNVKHFDGKAEIEAYIRRIGLPATFVQPGIFMSGWFNLIRKQENGTYKGFHPAEPDVVKFPAFDVSDTGLLIT